jgi:hypothetical protein
MSALILEAIEGVAVSCRRGVLALRWWGWHQDGSVNPRPHCYSIVIALTGKVYEFAILVAFASPAKLRRSLTFGSGSEGLNIFSSGFA